MFNRSLETPCSRSHQPSEARPSQRCPGEKKHPESQEETGASQGSQGKWQTPRGKPQSKPLGGKHTVLKHTNKTKHASKDPGISTWGFPLSPHPCCPGSFGKGQRCPLRPHVLAASAVLSPPAPSGWFFGASPHHGPSLGRGDVGPGPGPEPSSRPKGDRGKCKIA